MKQNVMAVVWLKIWKTVFDIIDEKYPYCDIKLESKMIDVDGTNLEEHQICSECSYGTPALL